LALAHNQLAAAELLVDGADVNAKDVVLRTPAAAPRVAPLSEHEPAHPVRPLNTPARSFIAIFDPRRLV
jgi:hypothetical protein